MLFSGECGLELSADSLIGKEIREYRVVSIISMDNFRVIVRAEHQESRLVHRLKIINSRLSEDMQFVLRFKSELQRLAMVEHPNLVRVLRYFEHSGNLIMVMDDLTGETLAERLDKVVIMPPQKVLSFMIPILSGLQALHDAGLIHRDIRPEVMTFSKDSNGDERPVINDFGVDTLFSTEEMSTDLITKLVGTGDYICSVEYCSPEHAGGEPLDPRSDLYSLGLVAYRALTGNVPFKSYSVVDTLATRRFINPPLISAVYSRGRFLVDLEQVMKKALQREAGQRFQTADAFKQELERVDFLYRVAGEDPDPSSDALFAFDSVENLSTPETFTARPEPGSEVPSKSKSSLVWLLLLFCSFLSGFLCGVFFDRLYPDGVSGLFKAEAEAVIPPTQTSPPTPPPTPSVTPSPTPPPTRLPATSTPKPRRSTPIPQLQKYLEVSSSGNGKFKTIAAAIREAADGAEIHVLPGAYAEKIVLRKPVQIIGDGQPGEIVIQFDKSSTVQMSTDFAMVKNLTIECSVPENAPYFAVSILKGRLILENCDISSKGTACIGINGPNTQPMIRNCKIHNCPGGGVFILNHGKGTIESCDIYSIGRSGIAIKGGADPLIRKCKIHGGSGGGIFIYEGGKGHIEKCEIYKCVESGIAVMEDSDPEIKESRIHHIQKTGVYIDKKGKATFIRCEICLNRLSGVLARGSSRTLFDACSIFSNSGVGIKVTGNSIVTIKSCRVNANYLGDFQVDPGSRLIPQGTSPGYYSAY